MLRYSPISGDVMKLLIILSVFITTAAQAKLIAICHNSKTAQEVRVDLDDHMTTTWKSIELRWSNDGHKYFRQFINSAIKKDSSEKIELYERNMFLGLGSKEHFELDKKKMKAKLKWTNRDSGISVGGTPPHYEPNGRFTIRYDKCELY